MSCDLCPGWNSEHVWTNAAGRNNHRRGSACTGQCLLCAHYLGNYKRCYSRHRQPSKSEATCMLPVLTVPSKTSSPPLLIFCHFQAHNSQDTTRADSFAQSPRGIHPSERSWSENCRLRVWMWETRERWKVAQAQPGHISHQSDSASSAVSRQKQAEWSQ